MVTEPEAPPFEQLLAQLRAEAYEFEKLTASLAYAKKHPLKVAELKQLFRLLSYDQTRLQLLQNISSRIRNPDRLAELEEELEYEISKKKLQKIISP
ncbi:MAG: DUF4476 domain-containing protein [Owenweeksia sp.]|nr:DUF4476 domain-containing protein [Owenweeksia sp.]